MIDGITKPCGGYNFIDSINHLNTINLIFLGRIKIKNLNYETRYEHEAKICVILFPIGLKKRQINNKKIFN